MGLNRINGSWVSSDFVEALKMVTVGFKLADFSIISESN